MENELNHLMNYKGMNIYIDPYCEENSAFILKKSDEKDALIVSEKIGRSLVALNRNIIIDEILDNINNENEEEVLLDVFPPKINEDDLGSFDLCTFDIVSDAGFKITGHRYIIPVGDMSKKQEEESVEKMLRTYSKEIEFPSILPMVKKVAAKTIANDLIFTSKEEIDEVKNRIITKNRDSSIESIIDGVEHIEEKLEDDEEYKKLISKGVSPMGLTQCNLMYMDYKYGDYNYINKTEE